MRILFELNSMNDQSIEIMQYHKLQSFIYSKLINQSQFKGIHDLKTYMYSFFIKYVNKLEVFRYLIVYIII